MDKRRKNFRRVWTLSLCFAAALCMAFSFAALPKAVYAMNEDYLSPQKWTSNRNVTFAEINQPAPGETLQGTFGYYGDDELCLYTFFSVDCTAFDENRDNARITFVFKTDKEEYKVSVDKDGLCDTLPGSEDMIAVSWNFDRRSSGEFYAAAQYLGKESRCTVDIYFYANYPFKVMTDILLERPLTTKAVTTRQTTTKSERTTAAKTSSTKRRTGGSTGSGTGSRSRAGEATTKFVPQGNNYFTESEAQMEEEEPSAVLREDLSAAEGHTRMSKDALMLLFIGIALAVAGLALIALACRKHKPKKTAPADNPEAPDDITPSMPWDERNDE